MKNIAKIIEQTQNAKRAKNISQEFQLYGVYLADSLEDKKHYSLYIKLAKNYDRALLEEALSFVKGATAVKSRGKLFMWKLKQLKEESKKKIALNKELMSPSYTIIPETN